MFLSTVPQIDISKIKNFCAVLWRFCNEAYFYVFRMQVLPISESVGVALRTWTFYNPFTGVEETIIMPVVPNIFGHIGSSVISVLQGFGIDLTLTVFDFICGTGIFVILLVGLIRWLLDILP